MLGSSSVSWLVYPIETIVAEKLHCLIMRGSSNSRSKDIFDLFFYLDKCDSKILEKALHATFS
ncbi:MAG: nucleotidyl transferase AbiEii/AbiGii toxin family protein [Oligoflexales bacterium]|nr:nucleotidyl transferase AbiEii/AbiGii toxin family protein [Oligoflexales bacterium]